MDSIFKNARIKEWSSTILFLSETKKDYFIDGEICKKFILTLSKVHNTCHKNFHKKVETKESP